MDDVITNHLQNAKHPTRRVFLSNCGEAALALTSSFLGRCSRQTLPSQRDNPISDANRALIADLEKRLPALLSQAPNVPAVSMALVADAKLVWKGAFGVKDRTSKIPVDPDTVFEAASVSKTVFAYAVMKLCEKGVLNLDTPLTKYSPDRPIQGDARLDLITPRMILSHTGGFQNWRSAKEPLAIHSVPGERWSYSGEGYSWLQSVMTHVVGHVDQKDCRLMPDSARVCASDFDRYMKANLLTPFGMTSSGYLYQEGMARHCGWKADCGPKGHADRSGAVWIGRRSAHDPGGLCQVPH